MATQNALVVAQVTRANDLVLTGNPSDAQKALVEIADEYGDKALVKALDHVAPSDLGQILVATATSPSAIVGDLITPKQFVKALVEVPKQWTNTGESGKDAMHQLDELFTGVVMRPDDHEKYGASAPAFLKTIAKNDEATRLLAWWVMQHDWREVTRARDAGEEPYEYHLGDWDHLLTICQKKTPVLYGALLVLLDKGIGFSTLLPSVIGISEAEESAL